MTKGFVVLAQNTQHVDYIKCAEVLARSIKKTMPNMHISLITDDIDSSIYFDNVIALPYGDQAVGSKWKLINDWQVYEASPYDETIKLEADLYIPRPIDYYFDVCSQLDVVVATTIRSYDQNISCNRYYRKFIDNNNLPDCYNAITYFKKGTTAEHFFKLVRNIFENWDDYKSLLQCKIDEEATTDWVYAIACSMVGLEKTTLPMFTDFSMIHMKQMINNLKTEVWTDELIYEISPDMLRINTVPQMYPFHYHVKDFCSKIEQAYGKT
jgi:hypothetical protein